VDEVIARTVSDLVARVSGPMWFRFILQPTMAGIFAWRAGVEDARTGQPAYFWAVLSNPAHRRDLLRDGWKDVAKVFGIALVLDAIYQFIQLRWFYPVQALIIAFGLAFIPYLLLRGPFRRIAGWWLHR
jgi:hypothetical protein